MIQLKIGVRIPKHWVKPLVQILLIAAILTFWWYYNIYRYNQGMMKDIEEMIKSRIERAEQAGAPPPSSPR